MCDRCVLSRRGWTNLPEAGSLDQLQDVPRFWGAKITPRSWWSTAGAFTLVSSVFFLGSLSHSPGPLPTANFERLLPRAHSRNLRMVLLNRQRYPGSVPFSSEELEALAITASAPPRSPEGIAGAETAMKDRARELYDYLVDLVQSERIPPTHDGKGGIIVVRWSLGAAHISSLLANVASFPVGDVCLSDYVKRVVFYGASQSTYRTGLMTRRSSIDGSCICFGYAPLRSPYDPRTDGSSRPEECIPAFNEWIGGYYSHGDVAVSGIDALEDRKALDDPPPSTKTMTNEEYQESTYDPPCEPNGGESLLARAAIMHGVLGTPKEGAFFLRHVPPGAEDWYSVEARYVWCENSVWEMPLGHLLLTRELEEAGRMGRVCGM